MPLPLCSSSTNHARLGTASPAPSGLNPIFPPLAEAAVLGHGPAASGCFSGIRAASAALEPALLPAKLLPFLQIFPLFSGKQPSAAAFTGQSDAGSSALRGKPGTGERGSKILIQPSRAGPTMSIQPLSSALCPPGAWDIFLRDQSFLCSPESQMLKAWWPSCSHGDGDVVRAQGERSLLHGQNWKAKSGESFHG